MNKSLADAEVLRAFRSHEALERLTNTAVGCFLVVTLMPAGSLLDYFVYQGRFWEFLKLRLACSLIAGLIWIFLYTEPGRKSVRPLGMIVPLLPVVFIAWMIAVTDGFASPYYAGLNLVLLAVGFVLRWTVIESILGVALVLLLYIGAGFAYGELPGQEVLFNNFYFIALMDLIVVVGTYYENRSRFREFVLRYELDRNRRMLEQSNHKLLELDQAKSRFFANISHELRTPLTLLLAPLESLLQRGKSAFVSETRPMLTAMQANGMRLLKLINDLLDLVRVESGRLEVKREPVQMEHFVAGLAAALRAAADDKRVRLSHRVAPEVCTVLVDRDKLEKILLNLMFNAVKFTPSGGLIEVTARRESDRLVCAVRDTGVGISPKNLPFVFDRFWQADTSSRRKYQGMGIGLALVKEFAELQGGSAAVESEEGKGATFTVQLPYLTSGAASPADAVPAAPDSSGAVPVRNTGLPETESEFSLSLNDAPPGVSATSDDWLSDLYRRAELFPAMTALQDTLKPVETPSGSTLPRLLVADDEPDMLRFLKSQLSPYYEVIEAVDGQQALDKAAQFLPDVILLDMMMPEKDGLEVCQELRQRPSTAPIPVVLLTARADDETKLAALKAGASDFLTKPYSTTELHVRVKNLVDSHRSERKLARQNQILESTIERLKETEMQLVQTEKLASLGRLSAGIIHEINNPLNFATTGLYTLRRETTHLPEARRDGYAETVRDIEEGITRVKTIVSDLRSFTHPDSQHVEEVDAAEAVTSALRFTSDQWRDKVKVEQSLAPGLTLRANRNRLIQVLVNLLQNSLDALRRKAFPNGDVPCIHIEGRKAAGKNLLIVRDNGEGIAAENLGKIFDPFFTTKDIGEGMGLGLSICYRIVQDYGGRIQVRSRPGQDCEFTLEFPADGPHSATVNGIT